LGELVLILKYHQRYYY